MRSQANRSTTVSTVRTVTTVSGLLPACIARAEHTPTMANETANASR